MHKEYIGDGVYAEMDDQTYDVILTTEDGVRATNRIVLEPEVLNALNEYLKRMFLTGAMSRKRGSAHV